MLVEQLQDWPQAKYEVVRMPELTGKHLNVVVFIGYPSTQASITVALWSKEDDVKYLTQMFPRPKAKKTTCLITYRSDEKTLYKW